MGGATRVGIGGDVTHPSRRRRDPDYTRGAPARPRSVALRRADRAAGSRDPRARPAPPRTPSSSSSARIRSSAATIGSSTATTRASGSRRDEPAGPDGGRHALGDERVPGRDRPGEPELRPRGPSWRAASGSRSPTRSGAPAPLRGLGVVAGHRSPASAARARGARSPSAAVVTAQAVPTERRRRVEVVERRRRHERLRQRRDPPHEVRAALRVELREDVVEQEQRRAAVERREQVQLGELEREDRGPLLAARRERRQRPAAHLEHEVVAVRADQRGAVPDLLLGRLGEAAGQGVADRLARVLRRVRRVGAARGGRRPPRRARSPRGRPRGAPPAPRAGAAAPPGRPPRPRAASRPRTGARRGSPAPRGSSRSRPLRCWSARPYVGEVAERRRATAGRRAGRAPRGAATASRRRAASPRARTSRSAGRPTSDAARRATPLTRIRLRAPPAAVRTSATSTASRASGVACPARRPGPPRGPAPGPSGRARRRRDVRWERPQASRTIASSRLVLPAALGPQTSCGPGREDGVELRVAAQVADRRARAGSGRPWPRRRSVDGRVRRGVRQEVVRTGITTWT